MKVKLLKKHGDFKKDEIVEFSNSKAARLIRLGQAVVVPKKSKGKK